MCMDNLDITDLKIFTVNKQGSNKIKAFCRATFNGFLNVSNICIKEGKKGIYVAFPFQKDNKGNLRKIVYPASKKAMKAIKNRILATYVLNHCVDDYSL